MCRLMIASGDSGVSSFMKKHKLKTQLDVTQSLDDADEGATVRFNFSSASKVFMM